MNRTRVLMAVIGNDVHAVANRIIDQYLSAQGYSVVNMGVACKPDEIIDGIYELAPSIVILSSLNGEASTWSSEFMSLVASLSVPRPKILLGGNLYPRSSSKSKEESEAAFYAQGFDSVLDYRRPLSYLEVELERLL